VRPISADCPDEYLTNPGSQAITFPHTYVENSVREGIQLRDEGKSAGKYPQYITSPESIPGLEGEKGKTDVDHFPLNHDGKTVFNGGTPTSDARVFYEHAKDSNTATFLGVWTHAGRKDGKFEQCTEV
jgi:hypothetical protein